MSSASTVSRFHLSPSSIINNNYIDLLPVEMKIDIADQFDDLKDYLAYRTAFLTSVGVDLIPASIREKFAPVRIKLTTLNDLVKHYEMNPFLGRLFDMLHVNRPTLDKTEPSGFLSALSMCNALEDTAFAACPDFRHYNSCFDLWNSFTKPDDDDRTGLRFLYNTCNNEGTLDRCWWIGKTLYRDVEAPACSTIACRFLHLETRHPRSDEIEATMILASSLVKLLCVSLADVAGRSEEGYSYVHRITPIVDVVVSSMAYELVSEVLAVDGKEKLMLFVEGFESWKRRMISFVEFLDFLKRISEEFQCWPTLSCHWCCREEEEQWLSHMDVDDSNTHHGK